MAKIIVIDPGHGGRDPGAVNKNKYEKVATLAIAKKVGAKLKEKGYAVKYTRSCDRFVTLAERCKFSNDYIADAFISIHLNAAANKNASGIETWRYKNVSNKTKRLADAVQTELVRVLGWKNRGVKETTSLYVLKKTNASAILVECGFISHDEEAKLLFAEKYQEKIAQAIVNGILKSI